MTNSLRMIKISSFESAGLSAVYYKNPTLNQAVGVLAGLADAPEEADCATSIPTMHKLFAFAEVNGAAAFELDLSRLVSLEEECVTAIAAGCLRLRSLGTRVTFVKPVNCRMDETTATQLAKLLQGYGERAVNDPGHSPTRVPNWLIGLGLKILAAVIFYFMVLSVVLAALSHPISHESRYAMDAVLAISAALLTMLFGGDAARSDIQLPLSKGYALHVNATGPAAVFLVVFVVARLSA